MVNIKNGRIGAEERYQPNMGRYRSGQTGRAVNPLEQSFGGSNPSLPNCAGIAQLVEHRPSKPWVAGSSPVSRFKESIAHVAQSVEHVLGKDGVISSSLIVGFSRSLLILARERR